ncbi:MAG: 30S ribosomal protein S8 [Microgenomates bacterium OLB22]|nr:MAG: 30S ribosomal protein S8 [Microgenomates bacterium OLB22]
MTLIDFIIRIKNGYLAGKEVVDVKRSIRTVRSLELLKKHGYIQEFDVPENIMEPISVTLSYKGHKPAISEVKLFSKPGRRVYRGVKEIRPVTGGLGIALISTSRGIMTDKQARKEKVGGELLFAIW